MYSYFTKFLTSLINLNFETDFDVIITDFAVTNTHAFNHGYEFSC